MQFVRQSKFRHVFCKPLKHEFCMSDVRITKIAWDALFCAVNPKFLAVIIEGSGGPFMVIPLGKVGRIEKDYPVVDAHKGPCLEVAWCTFNDNVIASGSEDCSVKVWHIPDGGLRKSLKEPMVELIGHQRRVTCVLWHPVANNVLLTASADLKIFLWNVATGEALIEIAGHPDLIWSVSFNYNGSKIATTCKDKKIRVIDPRTGRILQQGLGHEGVKPQRAVYLKDGRILTTGFTKRSERMYALRDEEALEEAIVQEELDTSNGVLFPFYDGDSGLVYLCGKGDCNIRYYEVNTDPPFVHYINTYTTPEPQRGLAFMAKRGLTVKGNEISRIYKVTNKGFVEQLQFYVPRKSELFQEDLFPDTPGMTPAISAEEWVNGKDADPMLISVAPQTGPVATAGIVRAGAGASPAKPAGAVKKANILAQIPAVQTSSASDRSTPTGEPANNVRQKSPPASLSTLSPPGGQIAEPSRSPTPSKAELALKELRKQSYTKDPSFERGNSDSTAAAGSSRNATESSWVTGATAVERGTSFKAARETFSDAHPSREKEPIREREREPIREREREPIREREKEPVRELRSNASSRQSSYSDYGIGGMSASTHMGATRAMNGQDGIEDLFADIQKLKAVVRRHERRIRMLEEQVAEKDMFDVNDL